MHGEQKNIISPNANVSMSVTLILFNIVETKWHFRDIEKKFNKWSAPKCSAANSIPSSAHIYYIVQN